MNTVEKLLTALAPHGVKNCKLIDIAQFTNNGIDKIVRDDEIAVNLLNFKDVFNLGIVKSKDISASTSVSRSKLESALIKKNDIYITPSSELKNEIGMSAVVAEDIPNTVYSYHIARIRIIDFDAVNPYFLSYLFQSSSIRKQINEHSQGITRFGLTKPKWESLEFPIPPMEIQLEIVKILDTFKDLEAELEAELEARKSQYDFYRDQLLGFSDPSINWAPFGSLATIVRGASPRPIQKYITDTDDGISWIKIGDTTPGEKYVTNTKEKITSEGARNSRIVNPGDFILSNSMSFGRPYISKIRGCIHDGWLSISGFEANLNPDYLYHVLQSHAMQMEFAQRASNGTVSNLNAEIVKSVNIPVPHLKKQVQIATTLNTFESLVNSQLDGIPAEIAARRQQYEYYRNKLLTFKELEVA